jgi:hypothetical protein
VIEAWSLEKKVLIFTARKLVPFNFNRGVVCNTLCINGLFRVLYVYGHSIALVFDTHVVNTGKPFVYLQLIFKLIPET